MSSDLLQSYEHDFKDCCKHLQEIIDDANPGAKLEKNQYAFDNASKLLKQMEVEAMNFMEDDSIRKRVSFLFTWNLEVFIFVWLILFC